MSLSGWGNFPQVDTQTARPRDEPRLADTLTKGPAIARGMGRSYGDSSISQCMTIEMSKFNRMISFDETAGVLVAEAGVTLAEVIESFLPRGWFPLVTPGTKFVSLGGAIASDVHGKNHHLDGSFRTCLEWLDLMGADGRIIRCSRTENADLFEHTCGGMGLTGIILRCAIRLRRVASGWLRQTTQIAENLDQAIEVFEANLDVTYSVAWIDCAARGHKLGRSLVILGDHALPSEVPSAYRTRPFATPARRKKTLPFHFPRFALNPLTLRAFNALYFWNGKRNAALKAVDWDSYFYPLDAIAHWNRLYGRDGFMQFQCALPMHTARAGLHRLLEEISASGRASFLSVLKRFGTQESAMGFPMEGYTLALDFQNTPANQALMERLDAITLEHEGRFYLTKDSRMSAQTLHRADPRATQFAQWRKARGLDTRFASAQSERLDL